MFEKFLADMKTTFEVGSEFSKLDSRAHDKFIEICRAHIGTGGAEEFYNGYLAYAKGVNIKTGASMRHENGFTKISLLKFGNGAQLRLHIWPAEAYADSRIHNHRWNLSSYVVEGELFSYNYVRVGDSEGDSHNSTIKCKLFQLFDADAGGQKESVQIAEGKLKVISSYSIAQNAGHYLDAEHMHKVQKPAGKRAVTLMYSGAPVTSYSIISEVIDYKPGKRTYFEKDGIEEELKALTN